MPDMRCRGQVALIAIAEAAPVALVVSQSAQQQVCLTRRQAQQSFLARQVVVVPTVVQRCQPDCIRPYWLPPAPCFATAD